MTLQRTAALLIALAGLTIAIPASAATITSSRSQVSAQVGNIITVQYTLNPAGERQYSAKLVLNYSPQVLSLSSFQYGDNWIALSQTGYDRVDNVNGTLIKTGGYPKGTADPVLFGTAQFRVIGSGNTTIALSGDSFVHNASRQNTLTGGPVTAVTATRAPAAAPKAAPTPSPAQTPAPSAPAPTAPQQQSNQNLFDVQPVVPPAPESSGVSVGTIVGGIVVLVLICWGLYSWLKKTP